MPKDKKFNQVFPQFTSSVNFIGSIPSGISSIFGYRGFMKHKRPSLERLHSKQINLRTRRST